MAVPNKENRMKHKAYIFQCRSHHRIKRIPNSYWQQVVQGSLPFPGYENQNIQIACFRVAMLRDQPQMVERIELESYSLNEHGFILKKQSMGTEQTLSQIFDTDSISDQHLVELVSKLDALHLDDWKPSQQQLNAIGRQIWHMTENKDDSYEDKGGSYEDKDSSAA
jgi:hypothetical protein